MKIFYDHQIYGGKMKKDKYFQEKMNGVGTKKMEIFGNFRRGGFFSKVHWLKLLRDEIRIRYDNGQNIFFIIFLFLYKLLKEQSKRLTKF